MLSLEATVTVSLTNHNSGFVLPNVMGHDRLLGLDVEKVGQGDVLDVLVCCLRGSSHIVLLCVVDE